MLTRCKESTSAGICHVVTLPAAVLRSIGSFLTTYECFMAAVCTCKTNEGLKPLLTSIEKFRFVREDVLPRSFLSLIYRSLLPTIGCSVKSLKATIYPKNAGALVQLLPRLGSLQECRIFMSAKEMRIFEQVFLLIPHRVRGLTLGGVDAEALRYLGEAATAGCLPVLEALAFPCLQVQKVEGMMGLQTALKAPSLGKNLKMLLLDFPRSFEHYPGERNVTTWCLLESVLQVEDQPSGILSRLETLVLITFTGWRMLAEYLLLAGQRLPGLKEVYNKDNTKGKHMEINFGLWGLAWYEVDSQTCRSWFELLYRRHLQTFNRTMICDLQSLSNFKVKKERIIELFRGLSNRVLKPQCISAIKEVHLRIYEHDVCSDTFKALARAIRLGNLRSVESLVLGAITTCSSESLASLGKALDPAFLPCLTSFSFGMAEPHHADLLGNLRDLELEERSLLLNSLLGSIPTGGFDDLQKFKLHTPCVGAGILLSALAEARPNCFHHLPELCLGDEFLKTEKMASVFEGGIFPCVECVSISLLFPSFDTGRMDKVRDFSEGMPRLLHALSDYTNIKQLQVHEIFLQKPTSGLARHLLDSMLSLLSGSTSAAFFPSLQILKIEISCFDGDYGIPDYFEPLLLSIKAVRPPNLKTIILGSKIIWKDA